MYTLLDFDDSLSQDEKNNIEEQLLSSGLMTALIIPDIYQNDIYYTDTISGNYSKVKGIKKQVTVDVPFFFHVQ